uniref:class I SAM-dependent methyltransferase n=1 Tax=Flavobacterium sp. TaxID=239 RepID=UPI0040474931
MKNILDEKPSHDLSGRLLASMLFVDDMDVKNKSILDIGCGYGWCELNFLERGAKKIVGVEISATDLDTIKKNISDDRLELRVSNATNLPFESNSFDSVVSWEVIEHIPRGTENIMFSEVSRVLKPGGVFYMSTPRKSFLSNTLDPAWWLAGHRHYSQSSLCKYANQTSLVVEVVKVKGGGWSLLFILNMYISKWLLRRGPIMGQYFAKKEHNEYMCDSGFANIFIKFRKFT